MKLKVVSYNVKALHYDPENPKGVADRREDVAAVIKELDGDIVGLQEIDVNNKRTDFYDQAKYLAEECGYPYFHFTPTTAKGVYGHAIMSRFPIKELEDLDFAVQCGEHRKFCRAVLDVDGRDVVFYNTHLTTSQPGRRLGLPVNKIFAQYQLMELMNRIYAEQGPTLLTGDFNLVMEKQRECVDVHQVYPLNGGIGFSAQNPATRIDNIFLKKEYILSHDSGVTYGEKGASDHPPISARIEI